MFHNVEQNTDEWFAMRAGKLTGSAISKVMANDGKAFGDPAKKLAVVIALEQIRGVPIGSSYSNEHMQRGHEQEPIARQLYEQEYFCSVSNGGFYDNGFCGCSPDGHPDPEGLIEIKSVIATVQYATMKRRAPDPAYKWQQIFNLMNTGCKWIDYVSFCADFTDRKRLLVYRTERSQVRNEISQMKNRVEQFKRFVDEVKREIES